MYNKKPAANKKTTAADPPIARPTTPPVDRAEVEAGNGVGTVEVLVDVVTVSVVLVDVVTVRVVRVEVTVVGGGPGVGKITGHAVKLSVHTSAT